MQGVGSHEGAAALFHPEERCGPATEPLHRGQRGFFLGFQPPWAKSFLSLMEKTQVLSCSLDPELAPDYF